MLANLAAGTVDATDDGTISAISTVVPLPAPTLLLLTGLAGLQVIGRRHA